MVFFTESSNLFQDDDDLSLSVQNSFAEEDLIIAFWKLLLTIWLEQEFVAKTAIEFITKAKLGSIVKEEECVVSPQQMQISVLNETLVAQ